MNDMRNISLRMSLAVICFSAVITLSLLASAISEAEDTDIFFTPPTATATINGPLVMIMLDTGANMTDQDRGEIANALVPALSQLATYQAKVGLMTSSSGAKVALPAKLLTADADQISPNAENVYMRPSASNFNEALGEYEAVGYSHSNPFATGIFNLDNGKVHTTDYEFWANNSTSTSSTKTNGQFQCPETDVNGNKTFLLPYANDTSSALAGTEVGYRLVSMLCSTEVVDAMTPDPIDLTGPTGPSPEIYYRFTNLTLNKAATVSNATLTLPLGCMGINVLDPNDASSVYVNTGSEADLEDMYVGAMDYRFCEFETLTSLPQGYTTFQPTSNTQKANYHPLANL